jgi:LPPG:FO 2-phospho-L-lactate transferase
VILCLCGGVGAARMLVGMQQAVDPTSLTAVVNTGDDEIFYGLYVAPDLDTITYTLGEVVHPDQGWGRSAETFGVLSELARLGEDTWFLLGDKDIALHLVRNRHLLAGRPLSAATADLSRRFGVRPTLLPMSDDRVRTIVTAEVDGVATPMAMQTWFVGHRHGPPVLQVDFDGASAATPGPGVLDAISAAEQIVVCPSNPYVSIDPILSIPGIRQALTARRDDVVAVSPLVGAAAVKGPAADMMRTLDGEVSNRVVARRYSEWASRMVIDRRDSADRALVERAGVTCFETETLMSSPRIAADLAEFVLSTGA